LSAAADLEALAQVLPVLTGSASPLVRLPGGQQDSSPAERVHGLLGPALRAVRRLAWMRRNTRYNRLLALLATHCYAGEARRDARWPETIALALMPREARMRALAESTRGGPDAAHLVHAGRALIAEAEIEYDDAGELASDGRWITDDLDEVSRALDASERDRAATGSARAKTKTDVAPSVPRCRALRGASCDAVTSQSECVFGRPRRASAPPASVTWVLLSGSPAR
jgi:hypothetical protein